MKIPANVMAFAAGKTELYEAFIDYWNNYRHINGAKNMQFDASKSFDEKETLLNAALRKEIMRVANVGDMSAFPVEQWAAHPAVNWATMAVVTALIDVVLPQSIIDNIGLYSDVRVGGFGDSFSFEVKPRDLFTVSKAGRSQRVAEVHKQFNGLVTVVPVNHQIAVSVSMYRVLAGKESLADFVAKAVRSMEEALAKESYTTWSTAMAALSNTATTGLRIAGYSQDSLVDLCQRVTAWNGGAKAVVVGTQRALVNVLPDDANYRFTLNDSFTTIGYIPTAFGYDVMAMPQFADWTTPFGTVISNSYIWIVSPGAQKPVKVCLEGSTLSNTNGFYDTANLTQSTSIFKSWGMGIATSAVAGVITL